MPPDRGPSPSLVKQMVYCPVIAWIELKFPVREPRTESMEAGREASRGAAAARRGDLVAVADGVERGGRGVVVVERKAFRSRSVHRYVAQAAVEAYAFSASSRVEAVALEVGGRRVLLPFDEEMAWRAKRLLGELASIARSDRPPLPSPGRAKCSQCWHRRLCPYSE